MAMKWYGVHTYSGYENKVKLSLEERIRSMAVEDMFEEILIPSETVVEMRKGERKTSLRKFFPGYILVRMELNDETWHVVTGTSKITGFVGGGQTPPVVDGPFLNFTGMVEDVRPDRGTLKVMVSIFGRVTPVELEFIQVEKTS